MSRQDEGAVSRLPFLTAGASSQARGLEYSGAGPERHDVEVRSVALSGSSVVQHVTASDARLLEGARRRVTLLAAALAALALVHQLAMYIIGMVEIQEAIAEIKHDLPDDLRGKLDLPDVSSLWAGSTHKLLTSIALSMTIPLCGYFGVKQSDARLLGLFSCCSGCCAAAAVLTALFAFGGIVFVENVEPIIQPWLHKCDPLQCERLDTMNHTIDCLAGSSRQVVYPNIVHLPGKCPQAFLKCGSMKGDGCFDPYSTSKHCSDEEHVSFCRRWTDKTKCEILARCTWVEPNGGCLPAGLPLNPVESCEVDKVHIEAYHVVQDVLPSLAGKLTTCLAVKLALTVPSIILMCLGTFWGFSLFGKLNAGYAVMGEEQMGDVPQAAHEMARVQPGAIHVSRGHVQPPRQSNAVHVEPPPLAPGQ